MMTKIDPADLGSGRRVRDDDWTPARQSKRPPSIQIESSWTGDDIVSALDQHDRGEFNRSGLLALWLDRYPKAKDAMDKRVAGTASKPVQVEPADDSLYAKAIAVSIETRLPEILPEATVRNILRSALWIGVSVCHVQWVCSDKFWFPKLTPWPSDAIRFEEWRGVYTAQTGIGTVDCIAPDWVVIELNGFRSWQQGLVRCVADAVYYAQLGKTDSASLSFRVGRPLIEARVPRGLTTTQRDNFIENIEDVTTGEDTAVICQQGTDGSGFGISLHSAGSTETTNNLATKKDYDNDITVAILGNNLSSDSGNSGGRALGEVQITQQILLSQQDEQVLSTSIYKQIICPTVCYNFGDGAPVPWVRWQVLPPKDKSAETKAHIDAAQAIPIINAALVGTGKKLDPATYLEERGLTLIAEEVAQ